MRYILTAALCGAIISCSGQPLPDPSNGPVNPVTPSADPVSEDPASADPGSQENFDSSYQPILDDLDKEFTLVQNLVDMHDRNSPVTSVDEDLYSCTLYFESTAYTIHCDALERGVPALGATCEDGRYYWTARGGVISHEDEVPYGKPTLAARDGKWYVLADSQWKEICEAAPADEIHSISLFAEVNTLRESVEIVFSDGSSISLDMEEQAPSDDPAEPSASVVTGSVSDITSTSATLNGSFSGASSAPTGSGFEWGRNSTSLDGDLYVDKTYYAASGSFSATLSSLEAGVTYYYRAYVILENSKYFFGPLRSFTTTAPTPPATPGQYLVCYEIPSVNLSGTMESGRESYGSTNYYSYPVNSSGKEIVVTHTYSQNGRNVRNYTVLFDGDKHCPIWSAFVMHDGAYPDNNVGRSGSWNYDPAVPYSWQQGGLDNANSVGYSRGHFVASSYRQSTSEGNKETFYYTNQAPQWQTRFNDGVWSSMENAIIGRAPSGRDTLYVTVGVLFETSKTLPSNGVQVAVPSHFYTCLMLCSFDSSGNMTSAKGEAYLFENKEYPSGTDYKNYRTSIDAVEKRAAVNLFANVPETLQNSAEAGTSGVL